jgi:hypothetical protein
MDAFKFLTTFGCDSLQKRAWRPRPPFRRRELAAYCSEGSAGGEEPEAVGMPKGGKKGKVSDLGEVE